MNPAEPDFQAIFAEEARGRLERIGQLILDLEADITNTEIVAAIFREAHTIKGGAAMMGLSSVSTLAHALEDLLTILRVGARTADAEVVDVILSTTDELRVMVDTGADTADMLARSQRGTARLRPLIDSEPTTSASAIPLDGAATVPRPTTTVPAASGIAPVEPATLQVPVERLDHMVRIVGEAAAANLRLSRAISREQTADPDAMAEYRDLSRLLNQLQEITMRARMVPLSTIVLPLHRAARDLARNQGKGLIWEVRGDETELDRGVLELLTDPLLHLVRNAVDHGLEPPGERIAAGKPPDGTVRLHAMQLGSEVIVAITDDGRGIDLERVREAASQASPGAIVTDDEALRYIFRSGVSTARAVTPVSGRGVGLDVVRSNLESVRGRVEVHSEAGKGSEFRIAVPITLAILPCMLLSSGGQRFAIPTHSVRTVLPPAPIGELRAGGQEMVMVDGQPVNVASLAGVLGIPGGRDGPAIVISSLAHTHAFRVEQLLGQRDVVVKGLGGLVPRLDVLTGASVEPDGSILLVLEAPGLIERTLTQPRQSRGPVARPAAASPPAARQQASLMVVDDALTVRELQRSILERAGYRVRTATQGAEALAMLAETPSDLVLTDVEMPGMDGFALTESIRRHPGLANIPVIIISSRATEQDRRRGLDAGADGYIVKSAFDQSMLLAAVERLLGERIK